MPEREDAHIVRYAVFEVASKMPWNVHEMIQQCPLYSYLAPCVGLLGTRRAVRCSCSPP